MCLKSHVPFDGLILGHGASSSEVLQCVVCKTNQTLDHMTAGAVTASGAQAAACYVHMYTKPAWLLGWAEFAIKQQSLLAEGAENAHKGCGVVVEHRVGLNGSEQAVDIARHLQVRQSLGTALIITERPSSFLSMVRKHWWKIVRILQRERASTLDPILRSELTRQIETMQSLHFIARAYDSHPNADVLFVTPEIAPTLSRSGKTIYISTVVQCADSCRDLAQEDSVIVDYVCGG